MTVGYLASEENCGGETFSISLSLPPLGAEHCEGDECAVAVFCTGSPHAPSAFLTDDSLSKNAIVVAATLHL